MAIHPASRIPASPFCSHSFLDSAKTPSLSTWQSTQHREPRHHLSVHTAFWIRENAQHVGMAIHPASRGPAPPFCPHRFLDSAKTSSLSAWASQACRVCLGTTGSDSLTVLTVVMGKRAEVRLHLIQRLLIFDAKVVLGQSA